MVTHPLSLSSSSSSVSPDDQQPPLCPCCRASRVRIRSSVQILYEVVANPVSQEMMVVDETVEEAGWEEHDEVFCPYCAWTGTVAELRG